MTLARIEKRIERFEAIRDSLSNKADKIAVNDIILRLMREAMDIRREQAERDLDRGLREHAAWHDNGAELN